MPRSGGVAALSPAAEHVVDVLAALPAARRGHRDLHEAIARDVLRPCGRGDGVDEVRLRADLLAGGAQLDAHLRPELHVLREIEAVDVAVDPIPWSEEAVAGEQARGAL
jgi:hypothetical protein